MTDAAPKPEPPYGMVAIFIDPSGRVIASVTDFARDVYGGVSLQKAQTYRVQRRLELEVVKACCSDIIVRAMDDYDCEQLVARLVRKCGCKVSLIPVGHEGNAP